MWRPRPSAVGMAVRQLPLARSLLLTRWCLWLILRRSVREAHSLPPRYELPMRIIFTGLNILPVFKLLAATVAHAYGVQYNRERAPAPGVDWGRVARRVLAAAAVAVAVAAAILLCSFMLGKAWAGPGSAYEHDQLLPIPDELEL